MKYQPKITLVIASFFFISQLIGIGILFHDIKVVQIVTPTGVIKEVVHPETVIGERPQLQGHETVLFILLSVLIGTGLILLLVKFKVWKAWKVLFFVAVFSSVSVALGVFLDSFLAMAIALILAGLKIFRPEPWTHNISEVFMYAGIVVLFAPLFDLFWISILLLAIAVYDYVAVYKTKHMVHMAKGLVSTKLFAGFFIPLTDKAKKAKKIKIGTKGEPQFAILGGGDIAFPLIFTGVALEHLITTMQIAKEVALLKVMPIPIFVTIALIYLLTIGKQGKFYPAMPFLTAGAFVGLFVTFLLV